MEKIPLVSVIIPSYNREHLIGRSIRSVLNQTYEEIEVIVVDDGSTDNTRDVVNNFNDKRIRYIHHDNNLGGCIARNTGINASRGEYIAFQDSDDVWLPDKLEKQMQAFKIVPENVGIVYSAFIRVKDDSASFIPSPKFTIKDGNLLYQLIKGNFISTQTTILRKICFDKAGEFDKNLHRLQDWELFIRMSKYFEFKYISEPLVIAYYQKDSISSNKKAYLEAITLIIEKHLDAFSKNLIALAQTYCHIGTELYSLGNKKLGREYLLRAIKLRPSNIKYFIYLFLTFLGINSFNIILNIIKNMTSNEDI